MRVIATASNACGQSIANPIRLLWVGGIPLVLAVAAELFVVQPFIATAFWPNLDPERVHVSVRLLVDPEFLGMRPLGPIFWFVRDIPWILFAAVFLYRWNKFAMSDWRTGSLAGLAWPVLSGHTLLLVCAAASVSGYAAGFVDWVAHGFQQSLPKESRISLDEGIWLLGHRHFPSGMVDGLLLRMFQPNIDRARYLSETRTISLILMLPVGAMALARLGLVVPARAAGRPMTLAQSWRLTRDVHATSMLSYVVIAVGASVLYALAAWALAFIPDPAEPAIKPGLFGWGEPREVAQTGALEYFLLLVTKALAIMGAAGCGGALMASAYRQALSRSPETAPP